MTYYRIRPLSESPHSSILRRTYIPIIYILYYTVGSTSHQPNTITPSILFLISHHHSIHSPHIPSIFHIPYSHILRKSSIVSSIWSTPALLHRQPDRRLISPEGQTGVGSLPLLDSRSPPAHSPLLLSLFSSPLLSLSFFLSLSSFLLSTPAAYRFLQEPFSECEADWVLVLPVSR